MKKKPCTKCSRAYTRAEWEALPLVGYGDAFDEGDRRLELRNCPCHSTIAVCLPGPGMPDCTYAEKRGKEIVDVPLGWGPMRRKNPPRGARKKPGAKKPARRKNPAPSYKDAHWGIDYEKASVESVPDPRDNQKMIGLGPLHSVVYITEKGFDGVSEYEHKFSSSSPPLLAYGDRDGKLYVIGGSYKVTRHGIVG